jgi:hypothetical protein
MAARQMKECARCGRRGTQAFSILDRTIEQDPIWVCSNGRTCMVQRGRRLRQDQMPETRPPLESIEWSGLRAKRRQAALPPRVLVLGRGSNADESLRAQLARLPSSVSLVMADSQAISRIGSANADLVVIDAGACDQIAVRNGLIRALTSRRAQRVPVLMLHAAEPPSTTHDAWSGVLALPNVRSLPRASPATDITGSVRAMLASDADLRVQVS